MIATDEICVRLGLRIARAREAKGWTQYMLAKAAGMAQSALAAIESGGRNRHRKMMGPTVATLARISHALDLPMEELIREDEPRASTIGLRQRREALEAARRIVRALEGHAQ